VAQVAEALRYTMEGRGFDSLRVFFTDIILSDAL